MAIDYPDWPWYDDNQTFEMVIFEVVDRILQAVPEENEIALAGFSLGGPIAVLVSEEIVRRGRTVNWVAAIDPVLPITSKLERGWLSRMRRRGKAARSRRNGLLHYIQTLGCRAIARFAGPRLADWSDRTRAALRAFSPGPSLLAKELRMRLLIGAAARWCDRPPALVSSIPCRLLYTSDTPHDADFWSRHFADINITMIGGSHDGLLHGDAPERLFDCYARAR